MFVYYFPNLLFLFVYKFELDGEEVSGVVMAKENQELKITYKITNPDYVFANESNGFMSAVKNVVPSKKQTETVLITSAMDGVTISADSYFNVEIKGA